jgi:hypothetical protein
MIPAGGLASRTVDRRDGKVVVVMAESLETVRVEQAVQLGVGVSPRAAVAFEVGAS